MKTQQEIEGMAEKRFPTINLPPDKSFYEHNLMQHGFIKGYQAAQEEMKQTKKEICCNCNATVEMVILDTMCPECKC